MIHRLLIAFGEGIGLGRVVGSGWGGIRSALLPGALKRSNSITVFKNN